MNFKVFMNTAKVFVVKNSPYILCGAGAVSITAGSIILARKAVKAHDTVDVAAMNRRKALTLTTDESDDEKLRKKRLTRCYIDIAAKYLMYYLPPALLITGGLSCMVSATLIQTNRLKALSAAYTSLAASYASYRERVKKVVGEAKENDIFHGIERDEKGEVITDPEKKQFAEDNNTQTFSRLFGDGNTPWWRKETLSCVNHVLGVESTCNAILRERGYITLNEVYDELGFKPSEEGMYLGWKYVYGDPVYGSTWIDLGLSGDKNKFRREELEHAWNEEFWIDILPPHVLFGKIPKEKIRSHTAKDNILIRRRQCHE